MSTAPPLVEMTGITKRYGGVLACDGVDLTVHAGEVHALLGENGAGKSTLMRVLSGDVTDHEGTVAIDGQEARFGKPADAQRAGVAMIHQELDLVPALSVAENLYLGRELRNRLGVVDRRRMFERTRELLRRTGIELDPARPVGELRVGEQQLVTIARALSLNAKVLIMDEPTSALSNTEVQRLFSVISELRRSGTGIVYISHRMDEIGQVADRATVLRNGRFVAEFDARRITAEQAAEAMVGREMQKMFRIEQDVDPEVEQDTDRGGSSEELLAVSGFAVRPRRPRVGRREPDGIDLTVRAGEIVGLCGLLGAGRTELLETLFGAGSVGTWEGSVRLGGVPVRPRGPRQALRKGIAFVPEDRRASGLVLGHSVLANTVLSVLDRLGAAGLVRRRAEVSMTQESVRQLKVKLGRIADPVGTLSGGNQQKVVFGRMLLTEPRLLLLDDPTRGVDIGAKAEIYQLLGEIAARGIGVLLASSELPELVGVCDRVVVLRSGRSVAEFDTARVGEAELLAAAMGERLSTNGDGPSNTVDKTVVGGSR